MPWIGVLGKHAVVSPYSEKTKKDKPRIFAHLFVEIDEFFYGEWGTNRRAAGKSG